MSLSDRDGATTDIASFFRSPGFERLQLRDEVGLGLTGDVRRVGGL